MATITILPERTGPLGITYRAVAGKAQSIGKSAGEALDALTAQLDEAEAGTLIVVQHLRPDRFFTAAQQRLAELMSRWRAARDAGPPWSAEEQAELDGLVESELRASGERAAALMQQFAT